MVQIKEDYLSKQNTDSLKGIFAICVLSHHLSQIVHIWDFSFVASIFQFMGYLSVAVFFFFSGYGLVFSYDKNPVDYIRKFPKNRIVNFYLKYCLIVVVYLVYNKILGIEISTCKMLKTITFGETIVKYGWYFQTSLMLYILFYLTFRVCKKREIQLIAFGIVLFGFCAVLYFLHFSTVVIECVFCMLLGMVWHRFKDRIDKCLFKGKVKFAGCFIAFFAFCVTLILWNMINTHVVVILFIKLLSAIFFIITVLFIISFFNIKNKLTTSLGKYYFEIYAFHGLFISLYKDIVKIENDYVFIFLIVLSVLIFSILMHPIFKLGDKIIKRG